MMTAEPQGRNGELGQRCKAGPLALHGGIRSGGRERGSPACPTQPHSSRDLAGLRLRGWEPRGSTRPGLVLVPSPCPRLPADLAWAGAGQVRPLGPSTLLSISRSRGVPAETESMNQHCPGPQPLSPGKQGTERGHMPTCSEAVAVP